MRYSILTAIAFLLACASSPSLKSNNPIFSDRARTPLKPIAKIFRGEARPVIRSILSGGAAYKAGLKVNDEILAVNGVPVGTAQEVETKIKLGSARPTLKVKRGGLVESLSFYFPGRHKLDADFEPVNVPIVRSSSPLITYSHSKDMTVYAQASVDDSRKELHINFIIESLRPMPTADVDFIAFDKGSREPFAKARDHMEALGATAQVLAKTVFRRSAVSGPIVVHLQVADSKFLFEFE